MTRRFYLLSLGCPKNTVGAEAMSWMLEDAGPCETERPQDADVVIASTRGLTGPACEEWYSTLREVFGCSRHPAHKRMG